MYALGVPASPRLVYRRLVAAEIETFHSLVIDDHVRRYLLDGALLGRDWSEQAIAASDRLFAARGVGLWLVAEASEVIGFCGFRIFEEVEPDPQLLYALRERHTGRGYATEMARALLAEAAAAGIDPVYAAVDAVNLASVRVLEKVGFRERGRVPGAFGEMLLVERSASPPG